MHFSLSLVALGSTLALTSALVVPINEQRQNLPRGTIFMPTPKPTGLTFENKLAPSPIGFEHKLSPDAAGVERRQRLPGNTITRGGNLSPPAPTACNTASVQANINEWQSDITDVNDFLNTATALPPAAVSSQAAALQRNCPGDAGDEPKHLKALAPCGAPADSSNVALLAQIFPGVLGNLSIITENSSDPDIVDCAISAIDYLRCNQVLPNIQDLFVDVAANFPTVTNTIVGGPTACPVPADGTYPSPVQFNIASCGPTAATKPAFCQPTLT